MARSCFALHPRGLSGCSLPSSVHAAFSFPLPLGAFVLAPGAVRCPQGTHVQQVGGQHLQVAPSQHRAAPPDRIELLLGLCAVSNVLLIGIKNTYRLMPPLVSERLLVVEEL